MIPFGPVTHWCAFCQSKEATYDLVVEIEKQEVELKACSDCFQPGLDRINFTDVSL